MWKARETKVVPPLHPPRKNISHSPQIVSVSRPASPVISPSPERIRRSKSLTEISAKTADLIQKQGFDPRVHHPQSSSLQEKVKAIPTKELPVTPQTLLKTGSQEEIKKKETSPTPNATTRRKKNGSFLNLLAQVMHKEEPVAISSPTLISSSQKKDSFSPISQKKEIPLSADPQKIVKEKREKTATECSESLKKVRNLIDYSHANSLERRSTLAFIYSALLSQLRAGLSTLNKQFLSELHSSLVKSDVDAAFVNACREEESLVHEISKKIIEFMTLMECLKNGLEDLDISIVTKEGLALEKANFLKAIQKFVSSETIQVKKKLEHFAQDLHGDEEAAHSTFENLERFFSSLFSLTLVYFESFEYSSVNLLKKGEPYRVKFKDRYGKDIERDAKDVLNIIPREITNYNELFRKLAHHTATIEAYYTSIEFFDLASNHSERFIKLGNHIKSLSDKANLSISRE